MPRPEARLTTLAAPASSRHATQGRRTLVVCDTHDVGWVDAAKAAAQAGDTWNLLLLGAGQVWFEREHGHTLAALGAARLLDVAALAPAANRQVSEFMVDLVHRLPSFDVGGTTLAARLQEGDRNLWWSLEITEKSSFRGSLVERLYYLGLVQEAARTHIYDRLWLRIGDDRLAEAMAAGAGIGDVRRTDARHPRRRWSFARAYWSRAVASLVRFAAVRGVMTLTRWSASRLERDAVGIFTLFPYWWIEPFGTKPAERFFSAPLRGVTSQYVAWVTGPSRIWRHRQALQRTLKQTSLLPLQQFVSWKSALRVLSPARFRRLARAQRAVQRELSVRFHGTDVSPLVAKDMAASMADGELFFDDLVYAGIRGYIGAARPSVLAYRVECQPWEHALVRAALDGGAPIVGFFHSMYGVNYPALRFARGEVRGTDQGAGARPLPGKMLVSGSTVEGYLVGDGYPAAAIARCGPQRHNSFVQFLRARPARADLRARLQLPAGVPVYFVAIAIVEVETEGLFACLEQALAGEQAFHLLIKTHPNRPSGDASMHAAIASLGSDKVTRVPAGAEMYDYIAAADTMVCIGSTIAFEAIALDVMPVVYEHPGTFAATSLRAFEDALYVVNSPASMRAALQETRENAPGAQERRLRWPQTLAGAFGDLHTPLEDQLQRALAQLGVAAHAEAR